VITETLAPEMVSRGVKCRNECVRRSCAGDRPPAEVGVAPDIASHDRGSRTVDGDSFGYHLLHGHEMAERLTPHIVVRARIQLARPAPAIVPDLAPLPISARHAPRYRPPTAVHVRLRTPLRAIRAGRQASPPHAHLVLAVLIPTA